MMHRQLTVIAFFICSSTTTLWAIDHEIICLEYPIFDDGDGNTLYAGDYYLHTDPNPPACDPDPELRYKWYLSDWAVPEGCPNCCDAYGTCAHTTSDESSPTPTPQQDPASTKKKRTKQKEEVKEQAAAATVRCHKLSSPIKKEFTYDNNNNVASRNAKKKGTNEKSADKWKPKNHVKVLSTNWALVKVKGTNTTIPVKVYLLQLDQKSANADLAGMSESVEKFKKDFRLVRIGFEADGIPDYLKNIPPVDPKQIDPSCKTMCTINVDGETDSYFVTTFTEVLP